MFDVVLDGNQNVTFPERCKPVAQDDWVLVKLLSVPMCNEYQSYAKHRPLSNIGHEAAGIVEDCASSRRFQVGDRVVVMPQLSCGNCEICLSGEYIYCRNPRDSEGQLGDNAADATFAPYMLKPDALLVKVPTDYNLDHAAMACCGLGPSFGAAERIGIRRDQAILVSGLGPVGLGAVINCICRGAKVIGVDPQVYRRELALELGADLALDPLSEEAQQQILDFTVGNGVHGAIECSGAASAQSFCIEAAGIRGHIACVGSSQANASVGLGREVLFKGLTIQGSWHYNRSGIQKLLRQIGEVGPQLERMITHRFPLTAVKEAWEQQCTGSCGKVILQPWT